VQVGDVTGLAEAIETILTDEGKRQELGERAREAVNERFSLARMVDETEKIYWSCD